MSEIPFVKSLGDEIERSAAERIASRRRRIRRRITLGALGFAVAATGVAAAAGVFSSSPQQLAAGGLSCYSKADLENAGVNVVAEGQLTPIATCRRVLGIDGPLVTCAGDGVMVIPGGPGTCERLGLARLPASYHAARRQVDRLGEKIMAIEDTGACWASDELATRVQALLDASPTWRGWHTKVLDDEGACGTVSQLTGTGARSVDGAFDPQHELVLISHTER